MRQSELYLSEAKQIGSFQKGKLNIFKSAAGSGKTTFVTEVLPKRVGVESGIIHLSPATAIVDQLIQRGDAVPLGLKNKSYFEGADDIWLNHEEVEVENLSKPVAMTIQAFLPWVLKEPQILKRINLITIDEADRSLYDLCIWNSTRAQREQQNYFKIEEMKKNIAWLIEETIVVAYSATGIFEVKSLVEDHKINEITFEGRIRTLKNNRVINYKDYRWVLYNLKGKTLIYADRVTLMKKIKKDAEKMGFKVNMITSLTAENYRMTVDDLKVREKIIREEKTLGEFDILIINKSMERGVNIHDKDFKTVVINSEDDREVEQVRARLRFDGVDVYYKSPYKSEDEYAVLVQKVGDDLELVTGITLEDKWLNKVLGKTELKRLSDELEVYMSDSIRTGRHIKWWDLLKYIYNSGYKMSFSGKPKDRNFKTLIKER